MPGICGIADSSRPAAELASTLRAMQDELSVESWYVRAERAGDEAAAIGSVSLGFERPYSKLAWDERFDCGLVLDGELYDIERLVAELNGAGHELAAADHAAIFLAGYLQHGTEFLRRLRGSFSAVIWNRRHRQLTLVTDRFGTRPLYYRVSDRSLRFASGISSLLADDSSPRRVNPRGLAQFFTFGHYLRDDTSLDEVRVLPAAACCTYSIDDQSFSRETFWSIAEWAVHAPQSRSNWLEDIDATFTAAVDRRTRDSLQLGLSLSGGLDARTILGVMNVRQTPVSSVCLGVRGSLDHRASEELAKIAGCPFHGHVLDNRFLNDFRTHLERMITLTDGQYLSQCIVIPTLSIYREMGIQALLRGHAGELMHMRKAYNYSLDESALQIQTDQALRAWLLQRLKAYMLEGVTEPLFAAPYQAGLEDLAIQSLDEDLTELSYVDRPLDRIWALFVHQRMRREMVLSMRKFRSVVEPRMPYLDNDLIQLLMSAPIDLKLGDEIQTYILRRRRPEFLGVTNANTGAPLGAGRMRQRIATLQMKVLARLGVAGYQPYERLGLWLRRELAPTVRSILLDSQTLDRGIFRPEGIKTVINRHLDQGHNHTFLIMALMIFELGMRKLVDSASPARRPRGISELAASSSRHG